MRWFAGYVLIVSVLLWWWNGHVQARRRDETWMRDQMREERAEALRRAQLELAARSHRGGEAGGDKTNGRH